MNIKHAIVLKMFKVLLHNIQYCPKICHIVSCIVESHLYCLKLEYKINFTEV